MSSWRLAIVVAGTVTRGLSSIKRDKLKQKKIFEIVKELEESEQIRIVRLVDALDSSVRIMRHNFIDLKSHLELYSKLDFNKYFIDRNYLNKLEVETYLNETQRLIHNYVTSTQSLIDHQRRHQKSLSEKRDEFHEYQEEVKLRFIEDPLSTFVGELRNYYNHYGIANIISNKVFDGMTNKLSTKLEINLDSIKKTTFQWKKYSKKYLESRDSETELLKLFKDYHEQVLNFQKWYKNRQKEIFVAEIDFVELKQKEIALIEINYLLEHINAKKGISRPMIENVIFKYTNIDHANEIINEENPKQKASLILKVFSKFIVIPPIMAIMITACYTSFE
jgi:hypothetical protein